ncbi:MAG: DUF4062 domain-containing protein [Nitrospira sp.]
MRPISRVFVSSTWLDLQPERAAVEKALQRMRQTKLNGMEYFGSRDENTRDVSLIEVDRSDVYVGIIGGRYGSGITEEEYRRASEKKLPRFLYFKDEQTIPADGRDAGGEERTRLASWKTELRKTHALGTDSFTNPDDLAARVTADLSNWFLEQCGPQLFLNGVGSLPYDYAPRIENFLTEYLGTSTVPVPFGGREEDLKSLDDWLEDNTALPYLMMAAPAGRGKSALLVRWTRQLLARPHISLVFVPISIRFRTNLSAVTFATLAARLATLHGEKVPDTPSTTAEIWRGLVTDYLRRPLPNGETLVVVLDGLDEAADWEPGPDLFPLTPPNHMRIVVSARYRTGDTDASDWLRRLGWVRKGLARSVNLSTLTKNGVARVLESMGFPLAQLGAKVDIVSELYRLTEGDPLLVKLYVEDLWSRKEKVGSLKPEDLGQLKPGLTGYFDRWWDDQRKLWGNESPLKEQAVQTLLSVLACSLGPLDQEGLLWLTKLSSWDLREAMKPLNRFIIGDGKVHGYAFSHPRLGEYFKDALSSSEQQVWQKQFLHWGRDTVQALEQGTLAPENAPAYLMQYYGAHLEQAHSQPETLFSLVCHGWSRAWEAFEGSFAGFLNDVERAWKTAEREDERAIAKGEIAPRIGDEIRCALVQASINSLVSNLPVKLIVLLVKYKKWTFRQGLAYAQQIRDSNRRDNVLLALTMGLATCEEIRDQALVEAVTAALAIEDGESRAQALTALAPYQPEAVRVAVSTIKNSRDRVRILTALLPHLAEPVRQSLLDDALAADSVIEESWRRADVLTVLAPYEPEAVRVAAHTIENSRDRVRILTALLPYVAEPVRRSLLEEVLTAARAIKDSESQAEVLTALLPHVAEPVRQSLLEEVLTAARAIVYSWRRADVLAVLAPYQPEAVRVAAHTIENSRDRVRILTALLPYVAEPVRRSLLEELLTAARAIEESWRRADVMTVLAPYQPEAVLAAAHTVGRIGDRVRILTALLPYVAEPVQRSLLKKVLTTARAIKDSESQAEVLTALLPHVAEPVRQSLLNDALAAARAIKDSESQAEVLTALLPHVAEPVRRSLLNDALAAASAIEESWRLADVLAVLAPYQPKAVLIAARMIENSRDRVRVLTALLPHVAEPVRQSLLEDALAADLATKESCCGGDVLTVLAPYQPEAVLAATPGIEDSCRRADILVALAPYQPKAVLIAARMIENSRDRVRVLTALLSHVAEPVRRSLVKEVLTAARAVKDNKSRAQVLTGLVPHMAEPVRRSHLEEALTAALAIKDSGGRVQALTALAPYQPGAVHYHLYLAWRTTIRYYSLGIRNEFMANLSALVPTIEELGKTQALEGTLHAVRDVTTWWP